MGKEWTGLRVRCIVKEEFVPVIDSLFDYRGKWENVALKYPQHLFISKYSEFPDAKQIPFSDKTIEPFWRDRNEFELCFLYNDRSWKIDTVVTHNVLIGAFLTLVLKNIAESVQLCEVVKDSGEIIPIDVNRLNEDEDHGF